VDARFGCDCVSGCTHVASVATSAQLSTAVGDASKTCIKLAAGVVFDAPSSSFSSTLQWLEIDHTVALVAEAGNATLDGGGATRLIWLTSAAGDVSLCNLVLTNGKSDVSRALPKPCRRDPRRLNERAAAFTGRWRGHQERQPRWHAQAQQLHSLKQPRCCAALRIAAPPAASCGDTLRPALRPVPPQTVI